MQTAALRDIRIVELSEAVAGEYCGKLLADFGAEVIKVERPGSGSPTRHLGPFGRRGAAPENSGLFAYLNTNKRSVALDLATPEGVETLASLVAQADVVIDDHARGWLAQVGFDPAAVHKTHPRLILCAITPFGYEGPNSDIPAEDLTVIHASGWGYHTPSASNPAKPPLKGAGRFMASYEAGLDGAMCVAACLHGRDGGGGGRFIDVSIQEVMASRVDYVLGQMIAGDMDVGTSRAMFDLGGPAGIFPCRDGFIYVFMSAPSHWQGLRKLVGDPEELRHFPANWLERGLTDERIATCRRYLGQWLATQGKDEAAAAAQEVGMTLVPINNASDLPRSPQLQHRGFLAEVDHPALGVALYPTVPYRLSATPTRIERAAPLLGERQP
jgi:crotonobetainyl-CoA:carnitine CoA-transferase CaiB-like acyl-CoA transferase